MADIQIKRIPRIDVKAEGSLVGTEPGINFIEGSGIALTVTDDPSNAEVDVTVAASAPALYYDTTGTTPKVSKAGKYLGLASTAYFQADGKSIDLTNDAVIEIFGAQGINMTGLFMSGCAALQRVTTYQCESMTEVDVDDCPLLERISIEVSSALASLSAASCPVLIDIYIDGTNMAESAVDAFLAQIDAGGAENGEMYLVGSGTAPPGAAGLVSKAALEAKGWTVTVNP